MEIIDFINDFDKEEQLDMYLKYKQDQDIKYQVTFESWLSDWFKCNNCKEWRSEDEKGSSELALTDGICKICMTENGYGK